MRICANCNNVMTRDYDGDCYCSACGREDYYETDGITRAKIERYFGNNGWALKKQEVYENPRRSVEVWIKKGYEYLVTFEWPRRLDTEWCKCIYVEQLYRAVFRVADSEGITLREAAKKLKEARE